MTRDENEFLTRVGPGTPMGELMRQYWIPALQSTDLPEKNGAPMRVRLLCENLVAFRNSEGRVGLIDHVCPHRCASLFFGRNEENGLRCLYHGWKFDVEGRCVDVPNEPPGSKLHEQVRVKAYRVLKKAGLSGHTWAQMGVIRRRYQNWGGLWLGRRGAEHCGINAPAIGCRRWRGILIRRI